MEFIIFCLIPLSIFFILMGFAIVPPLRRCKKCGEKKFLTLPDSDSGTCQNCNYSGRFW
jgi:hypothetical protein